MDSDAGRRTRGRAAVLGLLTLLAVAAGGQRAGTYAQPAGKAPAMGLGASAEEAESITADWPQAVRGQARALIEKYGPPAQAAVDQLAWFDNGPWAKTILYREALYRDPAAAGQDRLEQTIRYGVPADKIASLKRFSRTLEVDAVEGELSSCSDSEGANFLALNLADEIVYGRRTVAEARDFYARTRELSRAGKTSPYMEGLLFTVGREGLSYPMEEHSGYEP